MKERKVKEGMKKQAEEESIKVGGRREVALGISLVVAIRLNCIWPPLLAIQQDLLYYKILNIGFSLDYFMLLYLFSSSSKLFPQIGLCASFFLAITSPTFSFNHHVFPLIHLHNFE